MGTEIRNTKPRVNKISETAIVVIFFLAFIFSLVEPVGDPDMFWHLKTGEWIWQNKALQHHDPFSFTSGLYSLESEKSVSYILQQYWLAQLMMYGFYQLGGFYGIIAFRCLVYFGIAMILYLWMRKNGLEKITALILLIPAVWFSSFWLGERPDILSFLFTVLIIYLLEDLRVSANLFKAILLPLLLLLWTTMHTGFIIGDIIIGLYVIAEIIKLKKDEGLLNIKLFFAACFISIIVTMHKVIPTILRVEDVYSSYALVAYMVGPIEYARLNNYFYLAIVAAMILPLLLSIRNLRLRYALITVFLLLISIKSIRFIPLLMYITTMFISVVWGKSVSKLANRSSKFYIPHAVIIFFILFMSIKNIGHKIINRTMTNSSFLSSFNVYPEEEKPAIQRISSAGYNLQRQYPEKASAFIEMEDIKGNMFNDFGWGGYLIWRLFPKYKVFIDGRTIHEMIFEQYLAISAGSDEKLIGQPLYKAYLATYGIDFVVQPILQPTGQAQFLMFRLLEDDDWMPVYLDDTAYIFVKAGQKNQSVIERHGFRKKHFEESILAKFMLANDYLAAGEILWHLKRYKEAEEAFALTLNISPHNFIAKAELDLLRKSPQTGPVQFMFH